MVKEPIDWIRATFSGAIFGGFLWGIMVKAMFIVKHPHGPPTTYLYAFLSSVSIVVFTIGVVLYFSAKRSLWRSMAVAIILCPLTGWSILLFVTVTVVWPSFCI